MVLVLIFRPLIYFELIFPCGSTSFLVLGRPLGLTPFVAENVARFNVLLRKRQELQSQLSADLAFLKLGCWSHIYSTSSSGSSPCHHVVESLSP